MIKVLITDTHFGCHQNSMTWLNSQMAYIDKKLIPELRKLKNTGETVRLIHLGDVFDSRSSISPYVAMTVKNKFNEILSCVDEFFIIAGNHDFYSPNNDEVTSIEMVLTELFNRPEHQSKAFQVIRDIWVVDDDMFVPWYAYKDLDSVRKMLDEHPEVRNVYVHADVFGEDHNTLTKEYNINLFSGHIHIPCINKRAHTYNLGATYALNFADANSERGAYVIQGGKYSMIVNNVSIAFHRLYNEQIFNEVASDNDDYYELYVSQTNMQDPKFQARIAEIARSHRNVAVIPMLVECVYNDVEFESYDVKTICKSCIPEHLYDKFLQVLNKTDTGINK